MRTHDQNNMPFFFGQGGVTILDALHPFYSVIRKRESEIGN